MSGSLAAIFPPTRFPIHEHMIKRAYFAARQWNPWPRPEDIKHYFIAPPGCRWFFDTGIDDGSFRIEGVDGTDHLPPDDLGRHEIALILSGHPRLGVLLIWSKWDGKRKLTYNSKGNLRRLRELTKDIHGTPISVGLFVPYDLAWKAVKKFLENDGALPRSIEWIDDRDLPPNTFPGP